MALVRSLAFTTLVALWTILLAIVFLPLLALPRAVMQRGARFWIRGILAVLKTVCGLDHQVIGTSALPNGAALLAANHQSAWDTLIFHVICDDPVYLLKRELLRVPVFGWYLTKAGNIAIDRSAGATAIRRMLPEVHLRLRQGAQVIVFPEGTRTAPGAHRPLQPGIAAIYARTNAPVVPIALNSGLYWGRQRFIKYPGTITLRLLPPLPSGLDRRTFLAMLEARIGEAKSALNDTDGNRVAPAAETDGHGGTDGAPVASAPEHSKNNVY